MKFSDKTLSQSAQPIRWLAILITASLVTATYGQDEHGKTHAEHMHHGSHEGHSHDEDTEHYESHGAHDAQQEEADSHAEHEGHDHAEETEHGETQDDHEGHDDQEEDAVSISDDILREFDISLGKAGSEILHEEVVLPGEIQFNREQLAFVTPRYAGTVTEIKARLADKVKKGEVLATLESTETLRPFEVKAPFAGTVVAYDITPGETVEAGVPLFTVADLSSVWADLRIYQRDLNKIRKGQRVVVVNGHEGPQFTGTINYIAPTIDEHTRTGLARVIVDNVDGEWRPGQFVKGSVSIEEHRADIVIPRSAVLTQEGKTVVFVQTDEGFEPRPVELGHSDAASHEVVSGLAPGETYVTRNAISLKAEMSKGSFGGHAGHVH